MRMPRLPVRQPALRVALAAAVVGAALSWPNVGEALAVAAAVLAALPAGGPLKRGPGK